MKYRKKPIVIDAVQFKKDDDFFTKYQFMTGVIPEFDNDGNLRIVTLNGVVTAELGEWIIKGVEGELYPCKDEIFRATYEMA